MSDERRPPHHRLPSNPRILRTGGESPATPHRKTPAVPGRRISAPSGHRRILGLSDQGALLLTLIALATGLQAVAAAAGDFIPPIEGFSVALATTIAGAGGLLFGLYAKGASTRTSGVGGLIVGLSSALIGMLVSYFLGDVEASALAIAVATSGAAGGLAGLVGRVWRKRASAAEDGVARGSPRGGRSPVSPPR